jgi:uncharacterized protein (TIGR02996 family)
MTPETAFLDAILDDLGDAAPRLIFADWLDERGDPRGEFLRAQTELSRWVPDLKRRTELQRRISDMPGRFGADWIGPLRAHCSLWRFEGGLAHVTMTAGRFAGGCLSQHGDEWLRRAQAATVRLTNAARHIKAVAAAPALAGVAALDLSDNNLTDSAMRALAASPHLGRLRRLDLGNNQLGDAAAFALARAPWLDQMTELDLRNNTISHVGAQALLTRDLPRLRRLDLHGNPLGGVWLEQWSAWAEKRSASPFSVVNSLGMELARIPAGTFLMGSPQSEPHRYDDEGPLHAVTLSKPFFLSVYPVTQAAYQEVMDRNPSTFHADAGGGPNHPVDSVSWDDAVEFCRRLSARPAEHAAGRRYRLPTEAEWEHACRAGTTSPFWWGFSASAHQANFNSYYPYEDLEKGPFAGRTTSVGAYQPNPFGLNDMHGNVWEWCADWYDKDYYAVSPATDPPGPAAGEWHVLRGGCWDHLGACARAAYRLNHPPGGMYQGFRVALAP